MDDLFLSEKELRERIIALKDVGIKVIYNSNVAKKPEHTRFQLINKMLVIYKDDNILTILDTVIDLERAYIKSYIVEVLKDLFDGEISQDENGDD